MPREHKKKRRTNCKQPHPTERACAVSTKRNPEERWRDVKKRNKNANHPREQNERAAPAPAATLNSTCEGQKNVKANENAERNRNETPATNATQKSVAMRITKRERRMQTTPQRQNERVLNALAAIPKTRLRAVNRQPRFPRDGLVETVNPGISSLAKFRMVSKM